MKNIIITIFFIAVQAYVTLARAQIDVTLSAANEIESIKQEKLEIDANLKRQEALCYKKFAVSNCLKEAKTEAQAALNQIKRREIEIKEIQRDIKIKSDQNKKEKAVEKNTESVSAESAISESKDKSKVIKTVKPGRAIKTDAEVLAEKNTNDKLRADAAKKRLEDTNQKLAASQKKAQTRASKNSQSAANAALYNQKLAQAEAHKAALEKKNLERKKAKSAPLPIPNLIPEVKAP